MRKCMIWSNEYDQIHAIEEDLVNNDPDKSYEDLDSAWEDACELNNEYLEDERANLNINVHDDIIAIGYLGLWDGKRIAYKELHSQNIADCLTGTVGDYVTWYLDERGDLCCRDIHHDGTNTYVYRAWKGGVTEAQKRTLLQKIYVGSVTRKDITRVTRRLGEYVADIYGWKIPGRRS